ncbi:MAG: DUF1579 family protein [Candidatus Dadabacteria bacterium]|nr:DUF1579 family protein [Candidatus Dadabacteria bacterium]
MFSALALVLSFGLFVMPAVSQDSPVDAAKDAVDSTKEAADEAGKSMSQEADKMKEEMMAKWQEYATPGENHKPLDQLVGSWGYTVKFWETPESEPSESAGESEIKWILGGRYIQQTTKGMAMGQEFEGMGLMGYDNANEEYVSVWVDNMGTGVMTGTGTYDPATRTFEDKGTFSCPVEDEKDKPYRTVTTINGPDQFTFEMFAAGPDGKEARMMEIVYMRKN